MRRDDGFEPSDERDREGQGEERRTGLRPKWIVAIVIGVLLLIFGLQNSERVDVDFWVVDAQVRVVIVVLISAALGFLIGWLVGRPTREQRRHLRHHELKDDD